MNTLTWENATRRFLEAQEQMQGLLARMTPLTKETVHRQAEAAYWELEDAVPIVRKLVEALERYRRWEGEQWYPLAHAYCEASLVPHTDALFDAAEEAEVLALCFGKAFLAKMEAFEMPLRWEDVQDARTLLLQTNKALREFVAQEGELLAPLGV